MATYICINKKTYTMKHVKNTSSKLVKAIRNFFSIEGGYSILPSNIL